MKLPYRFASISALFLACGNPQTGPTETGDWESSETNSSQTDDTGAEDEGFNPICNPGAQRCSDAGIEICAETGLEWEYSDCDPSETCKVCGSDDDPLCEGLDARCAGPCDPGEGTPSSEGCSFVAIRLLWGNLGTDVPHSVVVGNTEPADGRTASVQLFFTPVGTRDEEPVGPRIDVPPGETHTFVIDADEIPSNTSLLRAGGVYRVQSDLPIVAYMYSVENPLPQRTNDSSLLLPETTFREDFVIPAYFPHKQKPHLGPAYFSVVALEDDTELTWTPTARTFGNAAPIPTVQPGETGTLTLNRLDNLRIAAASTDEVPWEERDLSGTVVHASKPVAVFSAVRCAKVPTDGGTCDHLQEQVIPLQYWGQEYVGPHAPPRPLAPIGVLWDSGDGDGDGDGDGEDPVMVWGDAYLDCLEKDPSTVSGEEPWGDRAYWRVYAGKGDMTVTTVPEIEPGGHTFSARGEIWEFETPPDTHLVLSSADGPFMPVQYVRSANRYSNLAQFCEDNIITGDPAMVQMVPVMQWLSSYTFVTGVGWEEDYAQLIRPVDGPEILVDGVAVPDDAFEPTGGGYEVANYRVDTSLPSHTAESDGDFGLVQYGYQGRMLPSESIDDDDDIDWLDDANASYAHPGGIRAENLFIP